MKSDATTFVATNVIVNVHDIELPLFYLFSFTKEQFTYVKQLLVKLYCDVLSSLSWCFQCPM